MKFIIINLLFIDDIIPREPLHLLKQTVTMQTEEHIHVLSMHVLANSRHTYDVTIWLLELLITRNIFIRSHEVRDNKSRLYMGVFLLPWQPNQETDWQTFSYFQLPLPI